MAASTSIHRLEGGLAGSEGLGEDLVVGLDGLEVLHEGILVGLLALLDGGLAAKGADGLVVDPGEGLADAAVAVAGALVQETVVVVIVSECCFKRGWLVKGDGSGS